MVTNLWQSPGYVYGLDCARGDPENRIKELHHGLALARTSCPHFRANAFRVLLTPAPCVLLGEILLEEFLKLMGISQYNTGSPR